MFRSLLSLCLGLILSAVLVPIASAEDAPDLKALLEAAMAAPERPAADRARDRNRKPIETLQFFGLRPDMSVLELVPGGGWYTRLLAPVLKDSGQLSVAIGTNRIEQTLLKAPGFEAVKVIPIRGEFTRPEGARRYALKNLSMPISEVDLALTFRNVHNFDAASRASMNTAVFAALKPGGHYGIVDHTRRHMDDDNSETWRRMDPVQVIKEVLDAGFEFVDYSTLHFRPDDELRYEVGRQTVTGNTDRFTLLFRKPK